MDSRLTIILSDEEREALQSIAGRELRSLRDQARYIIRTELKQRGLLNTRSTQNERKENEHNN